jgi:RsmE family RNA methyltransferase
MNRILFTESEINDGGIIKFTDYRATHILNVLHAKIGQVIRIGILNGPIGDAEITNIDGREITLAPVWGKRPATSSLNLLLALPRPKILKRLWAPLASLGLNKIIIVNAEKVERNYFDTHWLKQENYHSLLVEGLVQAGDTLLPEIIVHRRLKPFIEDELDTLLPDSTRILAHPRTDKKICDIKTNSNRQTLLAVGPEGGWNEFEINLMQQHNFQCITAGTRILRTDIACIALLALAQELLAQS